MTDDQAKAEVARLLLKRMEMRRLGIDLPPQDLILLKRLMYRLGMNNVKLQRRETLLRLARRIGVKRYAEPTQPVDPNQPTDALAPWRNPQPTAPKKTTKALQVLKDKAALVPVTDEPLPQVPQPARSNAPSRRRQVDNSVRNVPGGFSIHTRRGQQAFLDYLNDTGEDSDFRHRVEQEVQHQVNRYEPELSPEQYVEIATDNNWTPDEMIGHISQYHPEAENAIREWHRLHTYRPRADQPHLFDPDAGEGRPIRHRFDIQDELADPNSTWYSDSLMDHLQTYHPDLDHRAINRTLDALDSQRQSELESDIDRAIDRDRQWYEENMDTSEIENEILEQMHDEMEQEGRWEDRDDDEDDEGQTPQLNVVGSNEPQQQLPSAEPKPLAGGPQFGRWYGDSRVHTYRFQTPSGRPFTIDIGHYNEPGTTIDNLTFNDDHHSYADTGKGEAAAVFDEVSKAVAAYMTSPKHKPHILTFSAATTDGQATGGKSRQNLYTSLIKRIGQIDPNYGAMSIPLSGGSKQFIVFDRSKVDDVAKLIQNKFGGRSDAVRPEFIMSRRRETLHRLARTLGVRRYAKIDGHVQAHPLVQGFPIENALRHLANDPNNHPNIRELAKVAVTGGKGGDGSNIPTALWALHDELHEHNHPAKDWYNWMSAADKIGLDAHTYTALREESELSRRQSRAPHFAEPDEWHYTPESHAAHIANHLSNPKAGTGIRFPGYQVSGKDLLNRVKHRVKQLSPITPDKDIEESIRRHGYRSNSVWRKLHWNQDQEGEDRIASRDLGPFVDTTPTGVPSNLTRIANEKATRYHRILRRLARRSGVEPSNTEGLRRYQMVTGDFLGALRRIRSSDQHAIRKTTEEIAAKLGLKPASTVDALHNSPTYSVPGVAQAIYANARPEDIHAAAAWYGLTGNIPGMAVFHVRPDGPDMLHRFRMQGSGHDMLQKLDKAGITDRVLVPHRKGFDLLIPDRGGKIRDRVREFTQRQKTELQSSRGHFKLIGAADQAKAREKFRNTITTQERKAV